MAAEAAEEAAVAAATASDAQKEKMNTGKAGGRQNADILSAACFLCI